MTKKKVEAKIKKNSVEQTCHFYYLSSIVPMQLSRVIINKRLSQVNSLNMLLT